AAEDARAVGATLRRAFADAVRPAPVRPLATVDLAHDLDADTVVEWREGLRARVEAADGTVRILLPDKTIALPVEAADAVRALQAGPREAGRLPGLDPASSLVVARRLLREGVIVGGERA
ncbi:MAG: cupin, partial [Microbacterium sp.]